MAIVVGSARHDELGKYTGGKAGDQTGSEVSTQAFYVHKKGWYVLRPKDVHLANNLAESMIIACENQHLGYCQGHRLGVIKYGITTNVNTECDCSSLVRACLIASSGIDPGNFVTATEVGILSKTGLFESHFAYVNQTKTPLYDGDILVTKSSGHTVIVVSGNKRGTENNIGNPYDEPTILVCTSSVAKKKKYSTSKWTDSGNSAKWVQWHLHRLGYKGKDGKELSIDGQFGANSNFALGEFQQNTGLNIDFVCGSQTRKKMINS